jgi:hypothetical protein
MSRRFRLADRGRVLARVRRRIRSVLDAGRRRHLADCRFYQLLSEGDGAGGPSTPEQRHTAFWR